MNLTLSLPWLLCGFAITAPATSARADADRPAGAPAADTSTPSPASTLAPRSTAYTLRPSFMLGLSQWIVFGGGNVAAQVKVGRVVIEYSHGQALHFNRVSLALTSAERAAGVEVEAPWTTGGGVGYQITPNLHVMIEAKAHRYLVRDAGGATVEYTTFTVGPGVFYDVYLTKHLFLQPSLRWWPTLGSTHDRDAALMAEDGSAYRHQRHDLPPFANVSLGWTFDVR